MDITQAGPCLEMDALERFIAEGACEPDVERHLFQCVTCRDRAQHIRENNDLVRELVAANSTETAAAEPFADSIPGFRILADIQSGGQGVVYKAIQLATKRVVALKVLKGGRFGGPRRRDRFEREVELIATLHHPNIVTIFESGVTSDGRRFYAMEYIEGRPLNELIELARADGSTPTPTMPALIHLFGKICDAVNAAHLRGIVHRDLKPGNILIDAAGEPHVLDFGLAKLVESDAIAGAGMTMTGEFMGTLAYAAPEQTRGRPEMIDVRTDVYALGVVLFELLTGRLPYAATGTLADVVRNIAESHPERPSRLNAAIDDELETIVLKAIATEPERRYQSTRELAEDLRRYLAGRPISAKGDSAWYLIRKAARRYRVPIAVAASIVILIAAFGVAMAVQARRVAIQRDRADETARDLQRTLSAANVDRGRLMTQTGSIPVAERLLWREFLRYDDDTDPVGRQAHWALRELYSQHPCIATLPYASPNRVALDWQPGSPTLVLANAKGHVEAWDISRLVRTSSVQLDGWDAAYPPCISASARSAIARTKDHLLVWDLATGRTRFSVDMTGLPHTHSRAAVFDAAGARVAYVGPADRIHLVDSSDGRAIVTLGPFGPSDSPVQQLAFVPDGSALITMDSHQRLGEISIASATFRQIRQCSTSGKMPIAVSRDGTLLAIADYAHTYAGVVLDRPSGREVRRFPDHRGDLSAVAFSPDGTLLAALAMDKTLHFWNLLTGRGEALLLGNDVTSFEMCFHPAGALLASSNEDGVTKLWEVRPAAALQCAGHDETVTAVCYSPDGEEVISCDMGGAIIARDPRSGQIIRRYAAENAPITGLAISADGLLLGSVSVDGRTRVWDRRKGELICEFVVPVRIGCSQDVAFSPGGRLLASTADDMCVHLWDLAARRAAAVLSGHNKRIAAIQFAPDGRTLVSTGADSQVIAWDVASGREVFRVSTPSGVERTVAYSPDGRTLASGGDDGNIRLWNAASGRLLLTLESHQTDVFTLCFSPDGRLLAAGDRGGVILLWDAQSGRALARIARHTDMVFRVAFAPDSLYLASVSRDRMVLIHDLYYFDRHVAGNLAYQSARLTDPGVSPHSIAARRQQADEVWQCAAPRLRTKLEGITPPGSPN